MKLAVVTAAAPLTVLREGETTPVPAHFVPAGVTLAVDDQVITVNRDNRIVVVQVVEAA